MNERIKELKEQATRTAMWPGDPDAGELDAEKFAELIVRECADIVANADLTGWWITHPKDVLYVACNQVKKHFGVEE